MYSCPLHKWSSHYSPCPACAEGNTRTATGTEISEFNIVWNDAGDALKEFIKNLEHFALTEGKESDPNILYGVEIGWKAAISHVKKIIE